MNPAQIFIQRIIADLGGACGAPCTTGTTAGQIWSTAVSALWVIANQLGMLSRGQMQDAAGVLLIAGRQQLLRLAAAGDTTAVPALAPMLRVFANIEQLAPTLPAHAINPLDATTAATYVTGSAAAGTDPGAIAEAASLVGLFLAIPPGGLKRLVDQARAKAAAQPAS